MLRKFININHELVNSQNKEKPRNVKKYLLAALFNAPSTMGAFYQAEVNHDMAYGACEA